MKEGYHHYVSNVPEDDLHLLKKINDVGFDFYGKLTADDRLKYSISYDFHLKQPGSKPLLVNHKLKPLLLDNHSNPWIALCLVSMSSHPNAGNIRFKSDEDGRQFEYDLVKDIWVETPRVKLKPREKDILLFFSAQGLTMDQIADRLYVSIDTVKFHKKTDIFKVKSKEYNGSYSISDRVVSF
ncbi:helix-turn-helix transcriptional regulator [Sphingobacterium sp. E70]|uniref:helix-turn-helix transcriptional regulator n=1 Tax=Sphingobacterium sp. E70 TaxID=2853439 RepID=UPI00211BBA14|nr:helix-turn-helix transcriptional regulator [Sphingobacterium sp. E70]ULT26335.1 helix-turn-helix transcriptional regulator [Sphingobacterium sp. E70]